MKRLVSIVLLLLVASGAQANPPVQSTLVPITIDNVAELTLIAELPHEMLQDIYVSADGRLASVGYDSTAKIWDVDPASDTFGELLWEVQPSGDGCYDQGCYLLSVALHDDYLAFGNIDGSLWVYQLSSGEPLWRDWSHAGWVEDMAFMPNQPILLSLDEDGQISAWNLAKHTSEQLALELNALRTLAISHDGQRLAYAGGDFLADSPRTEITVRQIIDFAPVFTLTGHERPVLDVEFSPDDTLLASGAGDEFTAEPTIRLWDMSDGTLQTEITLLTDYDAHIAYPTAIEFSPDGTLLAVDSFGGAILFWAVDTLPDGAVVYTDTDFVQFETYGTKIEFNLDGTLLIVGGETIQLYGVEA